MKRRFFIVLKYLSAFVLVGLLYAIWCSNTHIRIPCVFHEITGFLCPGCGITRMCLSIMELDLKKAFYYNMGVFLLLPVFVFFAVKIAVRYIKTGNRKLTKFENISCYIIIVSLVLFGLIRNFI